MVECNLAKVDVASSSLVSRSKFFQKGLSFDRPFCFVRWASARSGVKVPKARSWSIEPKPIAEDKVQTVRNALKEVLGESLPQRTEITYKAYQMDKTANEVKIQKTKPKSGW